MLPDSTGAGVMGLRPPSNNDATKLANERFDKLIGRIYLLWLLGIGVGIIKLRADKVTFSGIEYTIENPDVIQGLIFVAVILCYVAMAGIGTIFSLQYATSGNRLISRRMIHIAARRTFRNKTPIDILIIKRVARKLFLLGTMLVLFIFVLPLAHILLFERPSLWLAINAMFTS
jgi:hypothetical protein